MKKILVIFALILAILSSCASNKVETIDTIIENAIEDRIFPGAVLLVGNSEEILYQKAYGNYTYDSSSKKVQLNTIFDLASLSKVFGTGMCLMKAIDSGLVDPDKAIVDYLPEMNNKGKDSVKVKNLLMHNSGMYAYTSAKETAEETWQSIVDLPLARSIGEYCYSCLNFISLMKVLESATGEPMWKFYQDEFVAPLKMTRTMYSPDEKYKDKCMPTIGDSSGTKILRQGEVHDPLALALEGYSGNAGLFSTAPDLAKLCQLMMNKGVYNGKRFVSEEVWGKFTTVQSGSRSWAWGVNNSKLSSAGDRMKETAIGHTGYTGTSAWLDINQDIFVILLTNRVYPQDKKGVQSIRRAVADVALENFIQD